MKSLAVKHCQFLRKRCVWGGEGELVFLVRQKKKRSIAKIVISKFLESHGAKRPKERKFQNEEYIWEL